MNTNPPESEDPPVPLTGLAAWEDFVSRMTRSCAEAGIEFKVKHPEPVVSEEDQTVSFVFVGRRDD
jgi:hypothetical protein